MRIRKSKISYYTVVAMMGFFATTPTITIAFGQRDIAVFRVFYYGVLAYLGVKTLAKKRITIRPNIKVLDIWLLFSVFSCLIGGLVLSSKAPEFSKTALSYISKIVAFLLFALVWGNQEENRLQKANQKLLQGVLFGCVANLAWATIDGIGYYTFGKSINNMVFSGYIARHHIRYGMLSLIKGTGLFRASGFNSDPAQIGFIAPLVLCFSLCKKKYWMIFLVGLSILSSASTTALVSSLIVVLVWFFVRKKRSHRLTTKGLITIFVCIIMSAAFIVAYGGRMLSVVSKSTTKFYERVNSVYMDSDSLTNVRWTYIYYSPRALANLNVHIFWGLGFGTGSYGYITDDIILQEIGQERKFAFDPENTYVSYLLDTGLVGFAIFLLYSYKLVSYFKRKIHQNYNDYELIICACILATVISMFFYHYIVFAPQVLITIAALTQMDIDRLTEEQAVISVQSENSNE